MGCCLARMDLRISVVKSVLLAAAVVAVQAACLTQVGVLTSTQYQRDSTAHRRSRHPQQQRTQSRHFEVLSMRGGGEEARGVSSSRNHAEMGSGKEETSERVRTVFSAVICAPRLICLHSKPSTCVSSIRRAHSIQTSGKCPVSWTTGCATPLYGLRIITCFRFCAADCGGVIRLCGSYHKVVNCWAAASKPDDSLTGKGTFSTINRLQQ